MKNLLILNGSPSGAVGNCAALVQIVRRYLEAHSNIAELNLLDGKSFQEIEEIITQAHGFLFVTGAYWDSWGSPLQKFLEQATASEGSDLWFGKPAAVAVLMHSVGGKEVLSRLQGVLNTFGLYLPPMSGFVYSVANHMAIAAGENRLTQDLWRISDLEIVCKNLVEAVHGTNCWHRWPVDREAFNDVWVDKNE